VENFIGELTTISALTNSGGSPGAVFFDEVDQNTCGYHGSSCNYNLFNASNFASQQAASNAMLLRTATALNAANLIPIFSLDNRFNASSEGLPGADAPCALPEDATAAALAGTSWVRFYENWPNTFWRPVNADLNAGMIQNAILEAAAGVPAVLHGSAPCPAAQRNITRPGPLGGAIEFWIASYLIVADAGTTLSLSEDWYDANFCWWPEFDVDFGAPLGAATRTSAHAWTRNFTRANVVLDVSSGHFGAVSLLA
jgi:hypothetical protein